MSVGLQRDLTIVKGSNWDVQWTLDFDVTGYTLAGIIRSGPTSSTTLVTMTHEVVSATATLSTIRSKVSQSDADGLTVGAKLWYSTEATSGATAHVAGIFGELRVLASMTGA